MEKPRVHEEAIRRHREIVAVFGLAHPRRGIVCMEVASNFAAESMGSQAGAGCAMARGMLSTGKYPPVAARIVPVVACRSSCPYPLSSVLLYCLKRRSVFG